jgi:hypothetical protein
MIAGGHFETRVYYAKAIRRFLRIDSYADPAPGDLVAVKRLAAGKVKVQRYYGQKHLGVVRVLERYNISSWESRSVHV